MNMNLFDRQHLSGKPNPSLAAFGAVTLLLLALFVCLFILQVQKNPLRLDEVDYFQSMQNVVKLGVPIYYAGEVNLDYSLLIPLSTRYLAGQEFRFYRFKPETGILKETFFAITGTRSRYTYGMWHPPLYIYFGALFFRLFPLTPDNSSLLRYFNLIFSAGMFGGMAFLARELYREKYRWVFLIALTLFTLNSLAVRGSLLIDYNATLGPCVAVWFATTYLWSERNRRLHWGLIFVTVLVPFTSLGIAASLLLGASLYFFLLGWRQRSWHPLTSMLFGVMLFFPVFLVFCRTFDLPFTQPFLHNFSRAGVKLNLAWLTQMIELVVRYGRTYVQEIGLLAVVTAGALAVKAILAHDIHYSTARGFLPVMIITGLVTQAGLGANAWGFMKYILFLLPLLFVYLAGEALLLASACPLPWKAGVTTVMILVGLTSGLASIRMIQAPGGTLYNGGEQGVIDAARALKASSAPDQVVLSTKDIAFFANRKFIEWFGPRYGDVSYVRTLIEKENIHWIAVNSYVLDSTSSAMAAFLKDQFIVQDRAGSFVILQKKEPPP